MDLKNYTARWTDEKFSEIQAKRGRLGGLKNGVANWDKREQAKEFRATGMTLQAIADRLEVAKGTISKWLKSDKFWAMFPKPYQITARRVGRAYQPKPNQEG